MEKFYKKLDEFIDEQIDKRKDIPILNFVLKELGEIPDEVVKYICKKTGIWEATIQNTIKFYPKYQTKNSEVIEIVYCNGRQCAEKCEDIISELKDEIEFDENGVSKNKKFKLSTKRCFGECTVGPNIEIDGLVYNKMTFKKLKIALGV